jgi:hypothetical protein
MLLEMKIKKVIIFFIKWFFISIFGIVGITAMLFYWNYKPPVKIEQQVCNPQVLEYSLGSVDSRFNLKNEAILELLKDSEIVWDEPLGYDVLRYNQDSDFRINFVFDDRQKYVEKARDYYRKYAQIEQDGSFATARKEKRLTDEFNAYEDRFKSSLDSTGNFIQGEYRGNEIDIFSFDNEADLKNLVAHEFGHALGIDDNQNPYSIMGGMKNDNFPLATPEDLKRAREFCVTPEI